MNKINISIIIPVYNTEKYLKKCLNSIANQTLKDIEIIVVNDGSPDNSEMVIKEFSEKNSNIRYIIKENGGLSSARNAGIRIATGEYIGFVDSDDYILRDMYEKMYNKAIYTQSDIVICDMKYDKDGVEVSNTKFEDFGMLNKEETMEKYLEHTYFRSHAQNKIYKRSLFKDIYFPEGKLFEDVGSFYKLLHNSEKVSFVNEKLYIYNQSNMGSITKKKYNIRNLDIIDAIEEMLRFLNSNNYSKAIMKKAKILYYRQVREQISNLYSKNCNISLKEINAIKSEMINRINKSIYEEGKKAYFNSMDNNLTNKLKVKINNINFVFIYSLIKNRIL